MTTTDRTDAQALADRRLELEEDHRTAAEYLDELRDELRAYADDPVRAVDIRAHLLTVVGLRDLAAVALEEAWRLIAVTG